MILSRYYTNIILILSLVFIVLLSNTVFAQEPEVHAGITPDSPLWGVDNALDRLSMLVSPANGIRVAEERLQEIKAMAEKNISSQEKVEAINKAEVERNNALEKGLGAIESITAEVVSAHHFEVLRSVREKVPEEARAGIDNAIIKSQEHLEKSRQRTIEGSTMASNPVWSR